MEIFLCRHGETEWSLSGQHTGTTDLPLTKKGEAQATSLMPKLKKLHYDAIYASPLQRAQKTAKLATHSTSIILEPLATEWNYGDYEGITTAEIHQKDPSWDLFRDGAPNGETVEEVGKRADLLINKWLHEGRSLILFSHGHFLRTLAARWIEIVPINAGRFILSVATLSTLGFERDRRVIQSWNT